MANDNIQEQWVKYPTGKIPKDEWCDACGRYNGRKVTCTMMVVSSNQLARKGCV